MRISLITLCSILLIASGFLLQVQCMDYSTGKHRFLSADGIARLPFHADLDHVVITANINGKGEIHLILDTGLPMPGVLLADKGNNEKWGISDSTNSVSLGFPGVELTEVPLHVEPAGSPITSMLTDVDGVIGLELFKQFAVTIDHDRQEITLEEPASFKAPNGAEKIPLMMRNGFAWLACSAEMASGAVIPMELVVDLGAAHALSLNVGTNEKLVPPDNAIETLLGKTMSGPIYGKVGRINSLHLGKLTLQAVMTSFQTGPRRGPSAMEKEGNLGNDALRRFKVTFDYQHECMFLSRNSRFSDPFEYNMSGIEYSKTPEGNLKIERILPASPAQPTELSPGDIISKINGKPLASLSKDELRQTLRAVGTTVTFSAMSPEGKSKSVTLTLRRVI